MIGGVEAFSADLADGQVLTTLNGEQLTVSLLLVRWVGGSAAAGPASCRARGWLAGRAHAAAKPHTDTQCPHHLHKPGRCPLARMAA